jgi:hypothetical protein
MSVTRGQVDAVRYALSVLDRTDYDEEEILVIFR